MSETIQDTVDRLSAFVEQNYTDIEVGPGSVVSELLLKVAAKIQNEQYNKITELDQGKSILAALTSDVVTYSTTLDAVASNYNVTRSAGTKVRGKLRVTISRKNEYNLQAGMTFIQSALGLRYTLIEDTRVTTDPITAAVAEIPLLLSQGLYYFVLDVEAVAAGPEYQLSSGTVFTLDEKNYISDLVKLEAYGNFSSGSAVETDKQLIAKIRASLGHSRFESAAGIRNKFKETFAGFQSLSVCGANDVEMTRSKQNLLGIATFGKADVYVRSSLGPEVKQITKTATKVDGNLWEMFLRHDDIPGFYYIQSILPVTPDIELGGTLIPVSVEYDYAPYTSQRNNELSNVTDARFSKYQTARVTFAYSDVPITSAGTTLEFEVHAVYQPNILEMQDMLLADDQRLACADYLVKAVVPCVVSLNINLLKKRATDTYESLNLQQLKKDIFTYVNTLPFGSELQASSIVDICHNYDIKRVDLPISMVGNILCPDGTTLTISDSDVLTIPDAVVHGVTPKTTAYFIDYYRAEGTSAVDNIGLNIA